MKKKLFLAFFALFAIASGAQAHEAIKKHRGHAVYQGVVSVNQGYVVPAPCPYPYGCDVNGYPYPPRPAYGSYVVPAPCPYPYGCDVYGYPYPPPMGAAMVPVALAVQAASGRHGGVSLGASVLGNPSTLGAVAGLVGNLFVNIRR